MAREDEVYTVFHLEKSRLQLPTGAWLGFVGTDEARGVIPKDLLPADHLLWKLADPKRTHPYPARLVIVPGDVATLKEARGEPVAPPKPAPAPPAPPPPPPVAVVSQEETPEVVESLTSEDFSEEELEKMTAPELEPEPPKAPEKAPEVTDLASVLDGLGSDKPATGSGKGKHGKKK